MFLRGALYQILQTPTYLGEVRHQKQSYPGQDAAIISRKLWDQVQDHLGSDNGGRKNKIKTNCSSLLLGLLQDGKGNRFHSSHTVKNGKRYRYYFSRKTTEDSSRQRKAIRFPAYDVEREVFLRLQTLLQSPNDVMELLSSTEVQKEMTQQLMTAAITKSQEMSAASLITARDFVRRVVRRVVVHADRMEVEISRRELRTSLFKDCNRENIP